LAYTLPSDGDLSRAEVVDGVVDPFLAVDIDVEQLCARDLDSGDAFGHFGADERERSPWHVEPSRGFGLAASATVTGNPLGAGLVAISAADTSSLPTG
jgi:hypothetical protein